ncbi:DUF1045 domain-containing protein [Magnetospirillum sulfuroxidans]|uniref:DUF1045 domain-containing protein n=1 Tax=Magnetospirillum sulfuroxidans TaxID=611300 RepID=A0ABS5IB00_9PROT|nr:DUF1045 domain-containing protein [Magnetospirillum sulfuroxidans]MBR9971494.1 DUF1045 domain-containing protein [Magnetospirillum sulfuroxidans]
MSPPRYALYFLPETDSALDRLGRAWIDGVAADLTAEARVYGFHATLKAPFRLADDQDEAALRAACAAFAATQAPLAEGPPTLALLDDFYALRPGAPSATLQTLAAECVRRFDPFRAPLNPAEKAKRLRTPLTPRQRQFLDQWGYPYVLDEYRFHLTLTRRLSPAEIPAVEQVLRPLTAEAVTEPLAVRSLCLMHQPAGGGFSMLARYPLEGACAS